ncbi:MAG: heavy metal-binding domain-containing protein, partial [Verrucomicrobiota bacterium]
MSSKTKYALAAVGLVVLAFLAGRWLAPDAAEGSAPVDSTASAPPPSADETWTCSMHPQILQPDPGDCPICGMDLIPLEDDGGDDLGPRAMSMSESAKALAEIQTT